MSAQDPAVRAALLKFNDTFQAVEALVATEYVRSCRLQALLRACPVPLGVSTYN